MIIGGLLLEAFGPLDKTVAGDPCPLPEWAAGNCEPANITGLKLEGIGSGIGATIAASMHPRPINVMTLTDRNGNPILDPFTGKPVTAIAPQPWALDYNEVYAELEKQQEYELGSLAEMYMCIDEQEYQRWAPKYDPNTLWYLSTTLGGPDKPFVEVTASLLPDNSVVYNSQLNPWSVHESMTVRLKGGEPLVHTHLYRPGQYCGPSGYDFMYNSDKIQHVMIIYPSSYVIIPYRPTGKYEDVRSWEDYYRVNPEFKPPTTK